MFRQGAVQRRMDRLPRTPLTTDEVGETLKINHEKDELRAPRLMDSHGSAPCVLYIRLGLPRATTAMAFDALAGRRATQVVVGGVLWATRFKYFEQGGLLPTTCSRCGSEDGFDDLLRCAASSAPVPGADPEPTVASMVELARRAAAIHKGLPIPRGGLGVVLPGG